MNTIYRDFMGTQTLKECVLMGPEVTNTIQRKRPILQQNWGFSMIKNPSFCVIILNIQL